MTNAVLQGKEERLPAAGQPCGKDLDTSSTHDTKVVSATANFCKMSRSYATALCKGLAVRSSPFAASLAKQLYFPMSTCKSWVSHATLQNLHHYTYRAFIRHMQQHTIT